MGRIDGADLSSWQPKVRWASVPSMYKIGIFKSSEGAGYSDPEYNANMIATKGRMWRAPYHFFRPSINWALQADWFLSHIRRHEFELPPVLDFEVTDGIIPTDRIIDWLVACAERVYTGYPRVRPMIYTGEWFLQQFSMTARAKLAPYYLWIAEWPWNQRDDITGNLPGYRLLAEVYPPYVSYPWNTVWVWQWTSKGRVPGVCSTWDENYLWAVDLNLGMKSWQEMAAEWNVSAPIPDTPTQPPTGGTMAAIHNTAVSQDKRAWLLTIESSQKLKVSYSQTWVDGIILPMGGMRYDPNVTEVMFNETTFPGRAKEVVAAGLPVLGKFILDAGAALKRQWSAPIAEKPIKENPITKTLVNAWHDGPWTWDSILTGHGKWIETSAIILEMVATDGYPAGTEIGNDWQARIIKAVTDHIMFLQDNGYAPKIPIIMLTTPEWLKKYDTAEFGQWLINRRGWLYLHIRKATVGSTNIFNHVSEIFSFPPPDSFEFAYTPEAYFERIVAHEFTHGAQKVVWLQNADGIPTPISLSLWCDIKDEMWSFLKLGAPVTPPPPAPVATLVEWANELDAWARTAGFSGVKPPKE